MGVNLIVGYAGQETLAQAAFVGIGAYLTAIATKSGVPFGVAFAASGLLTFAIGIVLGFPALRVQKHYLAFVTLAFSVLCWLVFRNEQWLTGGVNGHPRHRAALAVRPVVAQPRQLLLVRAGDHGAAHLRRCGGSCARRGVAPSRRCARTRCAPKASASTSGSIPCSPSRSARPMAAWRAPLCAAGRVHRPQPVRARPLAALHADGGDRRQRHLPRARSSAPAWPSCCPNGCAPGRPTTC